MLEGKRTKNAVEFLGEQNEFEQSNIKYQLAK